MIIMHKNLIKWALDFTIALSILILLLPFFLVLAIIIKLDSKDPVCFSHERVGKDLRHLLIFKFRTMTNEKDEVDTLPIIERSEEITNVGYYLRRFRIVELPRLVLVLKGDMSLIGPRSSIPSHLNQMTKIKKCFILLTLD
jgi:lipopolysaccharide/colanic/teichoic acid biosynthesis glycosyltransferase